MLEGAKYPGGGRVSRYSNNLTAASLHWLVQATNSSIGHVPRLTTTDCSWKSNPYLWKGHG